MEKNGVKKWGKLIAVYSAVAVLLIGCGSHPNNATVQNYTGSAISGAGKESAEAGGEQGIDDTVTSEEVSESEKLFIVEALDMTEETIALYSVDSDQQLRYNYNMTTKFIDKYGGNSTWAEFPVGTVVTIGDMLPSSGALSQVRKSTGVWSFEDIKKYKIDEEHGLIKIDGRNYKLTDKTKVYSDAEKILVSNISKKDKITVIGRDKEVISISVNTGHGYISLVNTSVFDGSMIFIGDKIATMVNGNETIEVPEGTYKVTVANNGWGGSTDITVNRDENVMVNLEELKGDGPSYCLITFLVTVPETNVYIDGKIIDTNEPQNIQYGAHKLVVRCSGYKPWNKTLIVNSASAEITLAMESDEEASSENTQTFETENNEENTESAGEENSSETTTNGHEEETAGSAIKNDYDYEVDYLSTISDLISNLMN